MAWLKVRHSTVHRGCGCCRNLGRACRFGGNGGRDGGTDAWLGTQQTVARLLGRDGQREEAVLQRLDRTAADLAMEHPPKTRRERWNGYVPHSPCPGKQRFTWRCSRICRNPKGTRPSGRCAPSSSMSDSTLPAPVPRPVPWVRGQRRRHHDGHKRIGCRRCGQRRCARGPSQAGAGPGLTAPGSTSTAPWPRRVPRKTAAQGGPRRRR